MGKGMTMASERLGNIEDLSYKDDISLFSQIGEYSQMQPFRLKFFVLLVCLNGHGSLNINGVDYRFDAGKMFMCKPYIIVEKSSVSLFRVSRHGTFVQVYRSAWAGGRRRLGFGNVSRQESRVVSIRR